MKEKIRIYTETDHVTFGEGGFVLTELDVGPARILPGTDPVRTAGRRVRLSGVLLPEGESLQEMEENLSPLRRRLCRLTAASGFTLAVGEKRLPLRAEESPRFGTAAPLAGPEALGFTVTAVCPDEGNAFFTEAEPCTARVRGWEGLFTFPLSFSETTLFALRRPFGTFTVENPGDVAVGFTATVTVEEGEVSAFTLSLPTGEKLAVEKTLSPGERITFDTRPGHKSVVFHPSGSETGGEGESLLPLLSADSSFFPLAPGENRLSFAHAGEGQVTVAVALMPRYF